MRKRIVTTIALVLFLLSVAAVPQAVAQETAKETGPKLKPADSYKVEFTVNELDNGKKINSRTYSMQIRVEATPTWGALKHLRVGSRVPTSVGGNPGQVQYMDVGMNIDCRLMPMGDGKVAVDARLEYSHLEGDPSRESQTPVVRHVSSDVEAIVSLDKPAELAEMDDVASTHRYTFEVKVTKLAE